MKREKRTFVCFKNNNNNIPFSLGKQLKPNKLREVIFMTLGNSEFVCGRVEATQTDTFRGFGIR